MSYRLLQALSPQLLADSTLKDLMATSRSTNGPKDKRDKSSKLVLAPIGEDMDARLRSIRRFISPEELASLLHCDATTVYRLIDAGMPVEYGVDPQAPGRSIKIYPPQFADWRREPRDPQKAVKRKNQRPSSDPSLKSGVSKADILAEPKK